MTTVIDVELARYNKLNLSEFKKRIENIDTAGVIRLKETLDERYYNTGEYTISDEKYDAIVEHLGRSTIGCKLLNEDNAVLLPFTLNSMDKIKQGEDKKIEKFTAKARTRPFLISDKLNGVSCLVCYGKNSEVKMFTRGDGKTGADISYFKDHIRGIVSGQRNINVRGELIITKQDFEKYYASKYKNSLALLVSVVNSKSLKEPIKHIRFVAYEIVTAEPSKTPSENLKHLEKCGFEVVNNIIRPSIDDAWLSSYLQTRYTSSVFSIDGVIVQIDASYQRDDISASGNPNYAVAYKMITDSCETEVEDVIWTASRYSTLKPRIKIKPIELCGVTITFVTGSNARFILDNKINKGSKVVVIRAGEIIPKIEEVLTFSKEAKMPSTPYSWNDSCVDIISEDSADSDDITVSRLTFFFSTLGVKQIAEGTIRKLVNAGYDDVFKIINMSEADFMEIPTFETKMSQKLKASIDALFSKQVPLELLMASSGLFGQGLGAKKLKALITAMPTILTSTPTNAEISKINGFSFKTAEKVLDGLDAFKDFYNKFSEYYKREDQVCDEPVEDSIFTEAEIEMAKSLSNVSSRLKGVVVVFTNFRDHDMEGKLVDLGATISESVTKTTTCVVVPDGNAKSTGKIAKAMQYGIRVLEKSAFQKEYSL